MDKAVKDLVKAITELQTERKKVIKIKEDLVDTNNRMTSIYEISLKERDKQEKRVNDFDLAFRLASTNLSVVYDAVTKAVKTLKKLRIAQNYPIKKIMQALEDIIDQRTETTPRINMDLKNDIKIQEIVEKRSRVLERLCNRLVGLIKVKKGNLDKATSINDLVSFFFSLNGVLIPTIHYIIAELDSETMQLNAEISSLSAQIDQLKGE